jgi:hypothetical protein
VGGRACDDARVRTLVISDLHLGTGTRVDLLRRPELRSALVDALADVQRLVVLGDFLELRVIPVRDAAPLAKELLQEAGAALGGDGEIVLLAGNHDHGIVAGWLEDRLGDTTLGLEHRIEPADAGPLATSLAKAARPARLSLAYPGIRLRDDVYALHGHYLDLHTTVPTFERLSAGAMKRWVTSIPEEGAEPEHYEAALGPLYAWIHAAVQRANTGPVSLGAGLSTGGWRLLAGEGRRTHRVRSAAARVGFAAAVGLLNRIGIGPLRRELSGEALRQGSLYGMGEALRRLGVDAPHVIFGHSHRAGPFEADDPAEWTAPTGSRMMNTGSWVYQRHFLTARPNASPYWPGTAVLIDDEGPPQLIRLLGERGHAELAPHPA